MTFNQTVKLPSLSKRCYSVFIEKRCISEVSCSWFDAQC